MSRRGAPVTTVSATQNVIDGWSYDDLAADRAAILDLRQPEFFDTFLERALASRA